MRYFLLVISGRQDLNRNFPKWNEHNAWESGTLDIFSGREEETKLLMRWILDNVFVISANFHDGAVLVNYPWDNYHDGNQVNSGVYKTPGKNKRIGTLLSACSPSDISWASK
jgi:hypothetical protein